MLVTRVRGAPQTERQLLNINMGDRMDGVLVCLLGRLRLCKHAAIGDTARL